MIGLVASALLTGYLPGALIFRLPILDRHRRAALDPAERLFWAVVISATLTLTVSLMLAAIGHYQWRSVLIADLLVAAAAATAGRGSDTTSPIAATGGPSRRWRWWHWRCGSSRRPRSTSSAARTPACT